MNLTDIAPLRLHHQHLMYQLFTTPAAVVGALGAMQAQEYALAKWAVGLRLPSGATDGAIEQAFDRGEILRTHVMRPTWHFVTPADIRWILALTAPRVHALNAYYYKQAGLDEQLLGCGVSAMVSALEGGNFRTRPELAAVLEQVGITPKGPGLAYAIMYAELEGIICSGPRRGNAFTYALLDERVPPMPPLSRDEALAEWVRRYFTSHGPARIPDFTWWSGLTVADARAGLALVGDALVKEEIAGQTYWYAPAATKGGRVKRLHSEANSMPITRPYAWLLPPYDEYVVAYKEHGAVLDAAHLEMAKGAVFGGVLMIEGQIVGNWRRTLSKRNVLIETSRFRPLSAAEEGAVRAAAERFGAFLGRTVVMG